MNRSRFLALAMLLLGACGQDGPCPPGYVLAPMNTCEVNPSAPPCDCFEKAPPCCVGDFCKDVASCEDDVWACEKGQHLMGTGGCGLPPIPAKTE